MDSIYDLVDSLNEKMFRFTSQMESVKPKQLGLDERSGYTLYVNEECIIVPNDYNDRQLQYYGGFEYVDKEFRQVIGDYVIYLNGDSRVQDCLDRFYDNEENENA